ncbi:hypothetical protein CEQ90_12105 [Lewinellaceae bacterium SD302]|nr:hypothetical protein CEQ90_12105 [Lewinellaceae bacterium SD302]
MQQHRLLLTSPIHEAVDFQVPGYGIGPDKKLSIPTMIEQMQEVALLSTRHLGVSVFDLEPKRLGWVLLGQRIELYHHPTLNDVCRIITCPTGFEKVFTYRDFHWLNPQTDEVLATASTTWMLMDLDKRRMATLPDWIKSIDEKTPPKAANLERATYKMVPPHEPEITRHFRVGYHELDFNGHLTNPVYVRWMLEGLDRKIFEGRTIKELRVQFSKEARYGDKLEVGISKTGHDGEFHHGLFRAGELIASLQTAFSAEESL